MSVNSSYKVVRFEVAINNRSIRWEDTVKILGGWGGLDIK